MNRSAARSPRRPLAVRLAGLLALLLYGAQLGAGVLPQPRRPGPELAAGVCCPMCAGGARCCCLHHPGAGACDLARVAGTTLRPAPCAAPPAATVPAAAPLGDHLLPGAAAWGDPAFRTLPLRAGPSSAHSLPPQPPDKIPIA